MGSGNTNELSYPSLEKRGRGDFMNTILESPFVPLKL
jgi:hypothetical protein